jgi:hypothetical protein
MCPPLSGLQQVWLGSDRQRRRPWRARPIGRKPGARCLYDLGFFDEDSCRLGNAENPFGAKVLPMSPE